MNPNSPAFEEDHESSSLTLSLSPPQPKSQVQPIILQQQQQLEPPQPKRPKPSSFAFQLLQPKAPPAPSFSSLLEDEYSCESLEPQQPTEPYTQSLQEVQFLVQANPPTLLIHQEQEPLPPCEFPPQDSNLQYQETGPNRPVRSRRQAARARKLGKTETINPPYQWATSTRATIHGLDHLLSHNIASISGAVQCKRCEEKYEIQFDLKEKFNEVALYIAEERDNMYDRAPESWNKPVLPTCNRCGKEDSLDPVISPKKRSINWLFLLLGQMIGCCKLDQLKYFCKHTKNHRTGAKDRLVYLTYLGLCKQLSPDGPFDP